MPQLTAQPIGLRSIGRAAIGLRAIWTAPYLAAPLFGLRRLFRIQSLSPLRGGGALAWRITTRNSRQSAATHDIKHAKGAAQSK